VNPEALATKSDYLALAIMCVLIGSSEMFEFWFCNIAAIHLACRGMCVVVVDHIMTRYLNLENSHMTITIDFLSRKRDC
jgi:hypothetical protein